MKVILEYVLGNKSFKGKILILNGIYLKILFKQKIVVRPQPDK